MKMIIKIWRLVILLALLQVAGDVQGQEIRKMKITELVAYMDSVQKPLVINFWATYCRPCLEEIPHLQNVVAKHASDSVELLLVSLDMQDDFPEVLAEVVRKRSITARVAWLDEHDADYFCPKIDSKWSGALPATLFLNNKKGYRKFSERALTLPELEKELALLPG